jgi:hypothetical protein
MSVKGKKLCRNCAWKHQIPFVIGERNDFSLRRVKHTIGRPTVHEFFRCKANEPSFDGKRLDTQYCDKFLAKKQGMTLEQQLEEIDQQKILEEKSRLATEERERILKENNRLVNRFRRHWKFVVELVGVVAGIATIMGLYLLLIHW